jgi:hypothetical protein
MKNVIKGLLVVGLILLIPAAWYAEVWIIHWAVGLFTPISMWQAFGITVLLALFSAPFRKRV